MPEPSYTLMDALLASPTDPLPKADIDHRVHLAERCLMSLVAGDGNLGHWQVCATVLNFMETFVGLGYAKDPDGLLADSEAALADCRRAALACLPGSRVYAVQGPGAGALLALITDYGECLRGVCARSAIRAMRATDKAMREAAR